MGDLTHTMRDTLSKARLSCMVSWQFSILNSLKFLIFWAWGCAISHTSFSFISHDFFFLKTRKCVSVGMLWWVSKWACFHCNNWYTYRVLFIDLCPFLLNILYFHLQGMKTGYKGSITHCCVFYRQNMNSLTKDYYIRTIVYCRHKIG